MILYISIAIFAATVLGALSLYWWMERRKETLPRRFEEIVGGSDVAGKEGVSGVGKWIGNLRERIAMKPRSETDLLELLSGRELAGARLQLNQAGFRSPFAYTAYLWIRIVTLVLFVILPVAYGKFIGMATQRILYLLIAGAALGYLLPGFLLRMKIRKRQEEITDSLPDGLDLLVVCVEAGLGLNASFVKITEEFKLSSPTLSEEFDIVNREMLAGKPRQEALRALADRTNNEDVRSLVAMLIQTEKLGTSLAQSLRVHSDSLRIRRRQKAEEAAAKTTIKLIFPLVFLVFPAMFVVILGPGALAILRFFLPAAKG